MVSIGYCPMECNTIMSQHIASGRDKLDLPGVNMAKHYNTFNWNERTRILDSFSSSDELTEVRTLFFVGLVSRPTWVRGAKVCVQVRIRYLQA